MIGSMVLAVALACTVPAMAQETDLPVGLCAQVEEAPLIDGKLDEAVWEQCEVLGPFVLLDGSGPARQQSRVRICGDGTSLFIGCELLEADMDKLKAEETPKDLSRLFANDCVEIFIQPDPQVVEYFHLAASAAGSTYDAIATGGAIDWTPEWTAMTSLGTDRWYLEAAIPLEGVGLAGAREGQLIRFNVCREEMPNGELSCWSCTRGTFHSSALFGELVFYSFAPLVETRMAQIRTKVDTARDVGGASPAFARAVEQLAAAEKAVGKAGFGSDDWRSVGPRLAALSKEFDRLAMGVREALIWSVEPWRLPAHTSLPSIGTADTEEITIRLMRGEYETIALGVANLTEASLAYHVSVTDLLRWHESEEAPAAGRITLREAIPMRTRSGGMVRDALPLLSQSQRLVVPPGENAVLWVTVHARDLSPGVYVAGIDLLPLVGEERRNVRLKIQVCPLEMPKGGPPYVCNWAYLDRAAERGWAEKASQDLQDHYLNVNMISHGDIPWPTVDDEGNITEALDFSKFDERIDLLPEGSTYLLVLSMNWFENLRTDLKPWTPEHKNALRQWSVMIRDHFRERGMGYDRWVWYPIDEPSTDKYAALVRNFADTVHEADREMMVYANPFSRSTPEQIRTMGEAIDVWAPNLSGLRDEDLEYMKAHGKRLWSYLVLSRLSNPYGAYRLPFWRVYDKGMTGFGYWAYDSVDGSVWDDADGRVSDYATYYEAQEGPIPSVRWEALREGAEDFRYLAMLWDAAAEARKAGHEEPARAAESALQEALRTTLGEAGKPETAGEQRGKLLDALLAVLSASRKVDREGMSAFARPIPVCLTGNGGPRVRNIDTGGHYTYTVFPTHSWNEQCGATEGKVWLRGKDATEGKQAENKVGGDLTDGSWFYRAHYVNLWIWGPNKTEITFDLMRPYRLARVDVFAGGQGDANRRIQKLTVLTSESEEGEDFSKVGEIPDCPNSEVGAEGEFQIDASTRARRVRIVAEKQGDHMTMAEVRIWGFPDGE